MAWSLISLKSRKTAVLWCEYECEKYNFCAIIYHILMVIPNTSMVLRVSMASVISVKRSYKSRKTRKCALCLLYSAFSLENRIPFLTDRRPFLKILAMCGLILQN